MFQQIEYNKRMSVLLIIAVTALLVVVGWAIGMSFGIPWYLGVTAAVVLAIVSGAISYYGGGRIVLALSSARKIEKADNPMLFNVVEEMSIAAGLPMPDVYIMDDSAPNALATGRKPEEAAVAVTTGLLEKLNRDELQGVIAHEMSHIRNYDILFMTMMAVLVGAIALLCDAFLRITWYGRGRYRGRGRSSASGLMTLIALILAVLAPIIGKLIQLAASRRREHLADASGALLTRYPAGLASALRRIAGDPDVLEAANRATQHMYIVNPLRAAQQRAQSLWSTHPAIEERIERLDRMAFADTSLVAQVSHPAPAAAAPEPAPQRATGPLDAVMPGSILAPAALAAAGAAAVPSPAPTQGSPCPRCSEPLARAKLKGRKLQVCKACGGVWIGTDDLTHLMKTTPASLVTADTKFSNLVGVGWNRVGPKRCPQCGEKLAIAWAAEGARVVVDRCAKCDGVWFDNGELAAVATAAQGGERGADA